MRLKLGEDLLPGSELGALSQIESVKLCQALIICFYA
jgi:hypothetical protein